jgi:hypothetical protein
MITVGSHFMASVRPTKREAPQSRKHRPINSVLLCSLQNQAENGWWSVSCSATGLPLVIPVIAQSRATIIF